MDATARLLKTAKDIGLNVGSVNGVSKMQRYFMQQFRSAVDDGADIHALDDQGKDAMDWLSFRETKTTGVCASSAKLLIDRGYLILDKPAIHSMEGPLRDKVLDHLARKERDNILLRDANGGNLLHVVAVIPRDVLGAAVSALPILGWKKTGGECKWVNDVDNSGRTPLHVMWQPRLGPLDEEDQHWMWDLSGMLERYGADILRRDNDGVCVLDLMERAIEQRMVDTQGANIDSSSLPYIAQIQSRLIGRTTPASNAAKRTLRL